MILAVWRICSKLRKKRYIWQMVIHVKHSWKNELLQLGLARLVEIIGEAARQLSDNFIETHAQIPWQEIMGMQNRIAHVYFDVDLKLLWDVIVLDLPVLLDELRRILNDDLS